MGQKDGQTIGEYTQNGTPIQETIYLGNMPVVVLKDSNIYKIYTDHLNTPRAIADGNNTVVWEWRNDDPFGANGANVDPDGDGVEFKYQLRYAGQYFDEETGLHQNWNRDYDPQTGKYIQSDRIGLAGGLNTYAYVHNNPLSYIDPDGLRIKGGKGGKGGKKGSGNEKRKCSVYAIVDCNGEIVYIGETYTDRVSARRNEHRTQKDGIIKKYSCKKCPLKFVGPVATFAGKKGLFGCEIAEAAMIVLYRPIFNTEHNPSPNKDKKREKWKEENCCEK